MTLIKEIRYKEPIKIRSRKLADGSESLYLDIYFQGERKYEFLKLYVQPEINQKIKELNKNVIEVAENIKSQRLLDLNKKKAQSKVTGKESDITLKEWLHTFKEFQKRKGIKNPEKFESVSKVILKYEKSNKTKLRKIDKEWLKDFISWLKNGYRKRDNHSINPGTLIYYLSQFSSALNAALQMGKINENPFHLLSSSEKFKKPETQRNFLSVEELKSLSRTECGNLSVKYAYLFSCYTGLRISDIREITWENLITNHKQKQLILNMKKTGKTVIIPLSQNALNWLPFNKGEEKDKIFPNLPCLTTINSIITKWRKAANIHKHLTYHTSRHTFATLMITAGADLYVTSKLMGHSDVKTTQIYAKIIDSKKIEAIQKIDHLFN